MCIGSIRRRMHSVTARFFSNCLERLMLVFSGAYPVETRSVKGSVGIMAIMVASIDSLGCRVAEKRARRRPKMLRLALSALLAATICGLPATKVAFADQVLELPRVSAPAPAPLPDASYSSDAVAEPEPPAKRNLTPLPADLGSVEDYENQGDEASSSPRFASSSRFASSPGFASGPSTIRIDQGGGRDAMVTNVILGALVIGLFAMEMNSAHQHRHR
jgi:hypothetical protein